MAAGKVKVGDFVCSKVRGVDIQAMKPYEVLNVNGDVFGFEDDSGDPRYATFTNEYWYVSEETAGLAPSATSTQVGGNHYSSMKIQPVEYIMANDIRFPEGNVIKYVSRWRNKNGIEDLKKARHQLDTIIEAVEKGTYK